MDECVAVRMCETCQPGGSWEGVFDCSMQNADFRFVLFHLPAGVTVSPVFGA